MASLSPAAAARPLRSQSCAPVGFRRVICENAGDHSETEHCLLQPGAGNAAAEASFLLTEVRAFAMGRTLPPTIATGPIEAVIEEELLQDFNVKYVGALRCSRAIIPGSAAKELMVCRLTAGANRIRTPGPTFRPCWVQ